MKCRTFLGLVALSLLTIARPSAAADPPRTLTTQFTYTVTVPAPPAGTGALSVWLPLPSDSPWQTVSNVTVDAPAPSQVTREARFGNRMVYLHVAKPTGPLTATVRFTVARREIHVLKSDTGNLFALPADLTADSRVPVGGRFSQIADQVIVGDKSPLEKERALFNSVVSTMHYDYKKVSPKYAQGDSAFVCDYKSGNCSDLHSYLISLSRSVGIPAVLEFGFPLTGIPVTSPLPADGKISGYHCWTWFQDDKKHWVPLDAADARRWTDAGRADIADSLFGGLVLERAAVAVSRGRDLTLSPPQKAGLLNYFIYPYAEADGQAVPASWNLSYHVLSDTRS